MTPDLLGAAPWPDLQEVRGQEMAKRALEVAAAGGHPLLLAGPAGSGKTTLARCLPGLLPPLAPGQAREVAALYALAAEERLEGAARRAPFRQPGPRLTPAGLLGGGRGLRPGEASLAHHGVLFLDELPEHRAATLNALCEPLDTGEVVLASGRGWRRFPARFLLVASLTVCPCGRRGDPERVCRCSDRRVRRHRARVPGSLLDRIGLQVELEPSRNRLKRSAEESSATVRRRVAGARAVQRERFGAGHPRPWNAAMERADLQRHCVLDPAGRELCETAVQKLSLRDLDQVRRVARTLADLAGYDSVRAAHLAEALQYRTVLPTS